MILFGIYLYYNDKRYRYQDWHILYHLWYLGPEVDKINQASETGIVQMNLVSYIIIGTQWIMGCFLALISPLLPFGYWLSFTYRVKLSLNLQALREFQNSFFQNTRNAALNPKVIVVFVGKAWKSPNHQCNTALWVLKLCRMEFGSRKYHYYFDQLPYKLENN